MTHFPKGNPMTKKTLREFLNTPATYAPVGGQTITTPVQATDDPAGHTDTTFSGGLNGVPPQHTLEKMIDPEVLASLKARYGDHWHDVITDMLAIIPSRQPATQTVGESVELTEGFKMVLGKVAAGGPLMAIRKQYNDLVNSGHSHAQAEWKMSMSNHRTMTFAVEQAREKDPSISSKAALFQMLKRQKMEGGE
jgi:hypothetical protein